MTRPLLMGIVNVTPDSFSDGGRSFADSVRHAVALREDGADILDIGGESTRPGAGEVPVQEELDRVMPVLEAVRRECPDCRISVDTRKAAVARAALAAGAEIVNDVSGLAFDPGMARTAAEYDAVLILGHTRGTPETMGRNCEYQDVAGDVAAELRHAGGLAVRDGVKPERLWYDPGIGFAKTADQSWELLRHAEELAGLGPLVIGHSRKSFLQYADTADRDAATAALAMLLALKPVHVLRLHQVRPVRIMLETMEKYMGKSHV